MSQPLLILNSATGAEFRAGKGRSGINQQQPTPLRAEVPLANARAFHGVSVHDRHLFAPSLELRLPTSPALALPTGCQTAGVFHRRAGVRCQWPGTLGAE